MVLSLPGSAIAQMLRQSLEGQRRRSWNPEIGFEYFIGLLHIIREREEL